MRGRIIAYLVAGAATGLSMPAAAAERQRSIVLMNEDPDTRKFQEQWGYADAIVSGDDIYLSGVVVGMRDGESMEAAYERAFQKIGRILNRAGGSWDDVIELTSFHTDLTTQMPVMVAVKNRYVKAPFPAWTAVGVTRLIPNGGLTEIKLVARRPSRPSTGGRSESQR